MTLAKTFHWRLTGAERSIIKSSAERASIRPRVMVGKKTIYEWYFLFIQNFNANSYTVSKLRSEEEVAIKHA